MRSPGPESFDDLASRLRERRAEAGSPSFAEISRRVGERRRRGGSDGAQPPARSTVYDCFRDGRRRVDVPLVLDIVAALGADAAELAVWRTWCASLQDGTRRGAAVLTGFAGVPARAEPFVVPERALARARRGSSAVVITGMPGAGKTQLAAAVIAEGRERSAITIDVRGSDTRAMRADARAVLDAVARQLGIGAEDPIPDEAWAERIADELRRTATAILLDDAASREQFEPLARFATTRVVVTTRSAAVRTPWTTVVELAPWAEDDTIALLRAYLGEDRIAQDAEAARRLAALTGGLPLATSIVAARVARADDWSLADHCERIQARLARLHVDDVVHAVFSQAYEALGREQRRALRLLAAQPCAHLPVSYAAELFDRSEPACDGLLRDLRIAHLVDVGDRVWMHRLVRVFVLAQSWEEEPSSVRDAAVDRLVDAYLASARDADAAWLTHEIGHLVEVTAAVAARRPNALLEATALVSDHLDAQGMFRSAEALQRRAYESTLRDATDEAKTKAALALGRTLVRRGRPHADAILSEALLWAERTGAAAEASSAANSLAVSASMRGDLDDALRRFRVSLVWAERADRRDFQGRLHDNIAILLRRRGELAEARRHHEQALAIAEELGDDAFAFTVLGNLSELLLLMGDTAAALDTASRAVEGGAAAGDFWQANALNGLGRALSASGQHAVAVDRQREALDLATTTGAPALIAGVHNDLGATYAESGDVEAARRSFAAAHDVAVEGGVVFEQAKALIGLAERDAEAGAYEAAASRAQQALSFVEAGGPEARRAGAVLQRVDAHDDGGPRPEEARGA
ncbi:tetratricopeptide repeat protein [Microbacterium betulae]|uniref:Tetratricopeptide repeat protein n=1 Tax=Microbacterium betulae TaxID=2981139 RepID=A0AA97FJY3_9MICO|nr:tetratricopeptide repeat protein [Microbacterium sp. AB]WOF24169.1 tetratricopeptide repeat protein [Microbacterium sp. AB]